MRKTQRIEKVSFIRQCYCEVGKIDCRREKREKKGKEKRNHKPAGTTCWSWLHFFAYRICSRDEGSAGTCLRGTDEDAEERKIRKNRRKYRAGGKDLKQMNMDQPSRFQRRCSFFASVPRSVFLFTSQHAFFCFEFALFK